jgi:SAM-dependent methyltransferase
MFIHPGDSHRHSLTTLNALYAYDDFMQSIESVVDLGCGTGEDLEWWATRTTRDEKPEPLNIRCVGIDQIEQMPMARKYPNINYQRADFETTLITPAKKFDVLWSHDSFQYCVDPIGTLGKWRNITSNGGMLALVVQQTTNLYQRQQAFIQPSGCYYHHTMVSLIHMLAINGWDCRSGFFFKRPDDAWINAIVYKSDIEPMDPKTTTWHDLSALKLLPESADRSIYAHGYLRQQDLVVPWVDKSLISMGQ